jgi:hypothetical protein
MIRHHELNIISDSVKLSVFSPYYITKFNKASVSNIIKDQ